MQSLVQKYLEQIYSSVLPDSSGWLADYIPELAVVNPEKFGICIATIDGTVYEVGDAEWPFTIQSVSKPFTYGMALADNGEQAVDAKIDVEPSGDAYNEISLERGTGRPLNPMINAGAILAASLVNGAEPEEQFERLRDFYSRFAGRELPLDYNVFTSEHDAGDRNRAIAYMLRTVGVLDQLPEDALDVYFRQCSVQVTARDLALMAATLANTGMQPLTGEQVLSPQLVRRVLSVMTTCGMYDAAGDWVSAVGLPAKSGVGGGILAVLPGQIGIAAYSPRIDRHSHSVRGVKACRALSDTFDLHFLNVTRGSRSIVRARYDLKRRTSTAARTPAQRGILAAHGDRVQFFELHGDLLFGGAEAVARGLADEAGSFDIVVIEIGGVDQISDVARRLLLDARGALAVEGKTGILVDPENRLVDEEDIDDSNAFTELADAVTWCEEELLKRYGT
ncbi:glutaminase A [Spelaeicoccus albus]|uniref:Glutaminase n=1 Tax=Spelaeicoccus albus TaxID=1280376 RepID=A0A7Z0D0G6_9MICO|nr:glutaminase A [Spelaeicoccus albus]NYI67346.1 glutaminase [Spelaeicoccus albus]